MYLTLYLVFFFLSITLIVLGFWKTEHTELSLIGFFFLFLVGIITIGGDIQYKTGQNTTFNYTCLDVCGTQNSTPFLTAETSVDVYETFAMGGTFSHSVGYWLAISALVGFIAVILSLGGSMRKI